MMMNEEQQAQLQKQLADLMQVVKDERKLRQQTEHNLAAAQKEAADSAAAAAAAAASAAAHGSHCKAPKIGAPDNFDGTRGTKAKVYVSQIGLYVISNSHLFPNDRSKVTFSLSYLTRLASAWAQPFTP